MSEHNGKQDSESELPEEFEPDEIEALREEQEEEREKERLTKDKRVNYAMLRNLEPIDNPKNFGAMNFMELWSFSEYHQRIMQFQQWQPVEGGEIQVRVDPRKTDFHGYAVVRPQDDPEHEIILRIWLGEVNSGIIMPRNDAPLPRQGHLKDKIMEQMQLIGGDGIKNYYFWIERMKNVK